MYMYIQIIYILLLCLVYIYIYIYILFYSFSSLSIYVDCLYLFHTPTESILYFHFIFVYFDQELSSILFLTILLCGVGRRQVVVQYVRLLYLVLGNVIVCCEEYRHHSMKYHQCVVA